jgi:hypothetical protein
VTKSLELTEIKRSAGFNSTPSAPCRRSVHARKRSRRSAAHYGFAQLWGLVLGTVLIAGSSHAVGASCPKTLMFDGLDIHAENNEAGAHYWGDTVGVQGFFINYIFYSWEDSVGDNENSPVYQSVKAFQRVYSRHGVTDNFLKVAPYRPYNWKDPSMERRITQNFWQAAHLARNAGLKGIALDIEPHVNGLWTSDPTLPDKAERVYRLGREVGEAIKSAYPGATVFVLPEVLVFTSPPTGPVWQRYQLSPRFFGGLIQARFKRLILGTELTYNSARPDLVVAKTYTLFDPYLTRYGLWPASMSIAPGLWPLGKSYTDKRARITPAQFQERLQLAMDGKPPYVWIYGLGNTWKEKGGPMEPRFEEYVRVIQQAEKQCN